MGYALIVNSESAINGNGVEITRNGEQFWVTADNEWVEATSSRVRDKHEIPNGVKIFRTERAAQKFLKRWGGHPWWCKPDGTGEIVMVKPKYKRVLEKYEPA